MHANCRRLARDRRCCLRSQMIFGPQCPGTVPHTLNMNLTPVLQLTHNRTLLRSHDVSRGVRLVNVARMANKLPGSERGSISLNKPR